MQERGGKVGLEEHPAEEVPGAEEGPGGIGDENLEVVEVEDYYDPDEAQGCVVRTSLTYQFGLVVSYNLTSAAYLFNLESYFRFVFNFFPKLDSIVSCLAT